MGQEIYFNKLDFIQAVPEACGLSSNDFSNSPFTSYIFNYVLSGTGIYTVNNRSYEVKAGDIFISPPYLPTSQHCTSSKQWEKYWIACLLDNPSSVFPLDQSISSKVVSAPELLSTFQDIVEQHQDSAFRKYYVCSKLYDLLFYLIEHFTVANQEINQYIILAQDYINLRYKERILISDVAAHVGLERSYFSRLFFSKTNMTPKEYLEDVRLRHAANMIGNHQMSINEIAAATGYRDVYNFSRAFKKKYHVSPNKYIALRPENL